MRARHAVLAGGIRRRLPPVVLVEPRRRVVRSTQSRPYERYALSSKGGGPAAISGARSARGGAPPGRGILVLARGNGRTPGVLAYADERPGHGTRVRAGIFGGKVGGSQGRARAGDAANIGHRADQAADSPPRPRSSRSGGTGILATKRLLLGWVVRRRLGDQRSGVGCGLSGLSRSREAFSRKPGIIPTAASRGLLSWGGRG